MSDGSVGVKEVADEQMQQWREEAAEKPRLPIIHLNPRSDKGREKFSSSTDSKWKRRLLIAAAALGFGGLALHAKQSADNSSNSPNVASTPSTLPSPDNSPNIIVRAGGSLEQAASAGLSSTKQDSSPLTEPDYSQPEYELSNEQQDQLLELLQQIKDNKSTYDAALENIKKQHPNLENTNVGRILNHIRAKDDGLNMRSTPDVPANHVEPNLVRNLSAHEKIDGNSVIVRHNADGDWAVKIENGQKVYFTTK